MKESKSQVYFSVSPYKDGVEMVAEASILKVFHSPSKQTGENQEIF